MKEKEEVIGTEQTSSVENKPKKQEESKKMVEEKSEVEEQEVISKVEEVKKEEILQVESIDESAKEEPVIEKEDLSKSIKDADSDADKVEEEEDSKKVESVEAKSKEDDNKHGHEDKLAKEDFSKYTKSQLVELLKTLAKHNDPLYADRYLKRVEPLFEEIKKADVEEAKAAYIKENGKEEGFSFNTDELTNRFYANSRLIHDHRHAFLKERESQRQENLKKAEAALEKLRQFVDSEESSTSFNKFKEIQSEWKAIGDVPGNQSKTLWANFNALINRFYDQRSIYFELKELDRKKNFEAKVKICERAESLEEFENLKEAINTLNNLHSDYKHLGPVPQELQEDLWVRFKAASDKVYQKRKEFVTDLKEVLLENLKKKEELVDSIKGFVEFNSDRIKEWNSKTKELLELQKKWEAIGGLPREKSKEINKGFWSSFKTFFHNKGNFFKKLDAERKGNYDAKILLVEKAESLKDNTDWLKTADAYKALQLQWKEVGPVPEKFRNEIYEKFKTACDFFFNSKRSNSKDEEKSYKQNLNLKRDILSQIKDWTSEADSHIDEFKNKTKEFSAVGFVPRKEIGAIKDKFSEVADAFISALSSDNEVKDTLRMEIELGDILGSKNSDKVIYGKEQNIRRQIQHLENDVALWRNNLEFFAHSKNADELRKDVNLKIDKAESKVAVLKGQLKILRTI